MNQDDPSRVPGAEPLSVAAHFECDGLPGAKGCDWAGLETADWRCPKCRAKIRPVQALRAERTAAPASGEALRYALQRIVDHIERVKLRADVFLIQQTAEAALARVPPAPQPPVATCKVRASGKTDPPQDCDWPFCGCDPHADKVIAAIQECGWAPPVPAAQAHDVGAHPHCPRCKGSGKADNAQFSCGCRWAGSPYRKAAEAAAQARNAGRVDLDRLHELETTCILESENATDETQARAWHERAKCAYHTREYLAALQRTRETGE